MVNLCGVLESKVAQVVLMALGFCLALVGFVLSMVNIQSKSKVSCCVVFFILSLVCSALLLCGILSKRYNWSDPLRKVKTTYVNQQINVLRNMNARSATGVPSQ